MGRASNRVADHPRAPLERHACGELQTLYSHVRSASVLNDAWRTVRSNGLASTVRYTRDEILDFEVHAHRHLRRIQSQLKACRFSFDPQLGILQKRPGKKPRPIVIASIKNRV